VPYLHVRRRELYQAEQVLLRLALLAAGAGETCGPPPSVTPRGPMRRSRTPQAQPKTLPKPHKSTGATALIERRNRRAHVRPFRLTGRSALGYRLNRSCAVRSGAGHV
jgi:hypothetical protein